MNKRTANRRNRQDMGLMRHEVRYWLLQTNNEPHKAHETMIKHYLVNGKMIPYYVKGVRDFIQESQQLALELNREDQMKKSDRENKKNRNNKIDKIMSMDIESIRSIYKQNKDEVSASEKILLAELYTMIYTGELEEKFIGSDTIRMMDKIWSE